MPVLIGTGSGRLPGPRRQTVSFPGRRGAATAFRVAGGGGNEAQRGARDLDRLGPAIDDDVDHRRHPRQQLELVVARQDLDDIGETPFGDLRRLLDVDHFPLEDLTRVGTEDESRRLAGSDLGLTSASSRDGLHVHLLEIRGDREQHLADVDGSADNGVLGHDDAGDRSANGGALDIRFRLTDGNLAGGKGRLGIAKLRFGTTSSCACAAAAEATARPPRAPSPPPYRRWRGPAPFSPAPFRSARHRLVAASFCLIERSRCASLTA
ncbi:MAG: hypothetical protein U1E43_04650 [Rhodospirillales bacterium]